MDILNIFKRKKDNAHIPSPNFENNWMQEKYEKNVKEGVLALQKGRGVNIIDDGRGYELALAIKSQFILEYQKQLAESIKINNGGTSITIRIENTVHETINNR